MRIESGCVGWLSGLAGKSGPLEFGMTAGGRGVWTKATKRKRASDIEGSRRSTGEDAISLFSFLQDRLPMDGARRDSARRRVWLDRGSRKRQREMCVCMSDDDESREWAVPALLSKLVMGGRKVSTLGSWRREVEERTGRGRRDGTEADGRWVNMDGQERGIVGFPFPGCGRCGRWMQGT